MSFDEDRLDADAENRAQDDLTAEGSDDWVLTMIKQLVVASDSSRLEHVTSSECMDQREVPAGLLLLFIDSDEEGSLRA